MWYTFNLTKNPVGGIHPFDVNSKRVKIRCHFKVKYQQLLINSWVLVLSATEKMLYGAETNLLSLSKDQLPCVYGISNKFTNGPHSYMQIFR